MNILVTGAAGFIGSNLVHFLHRERPAWKIFALDSLSYAGNLENLEPLLSEKKIEFVKMNICDEEGIQALFKSSPFDLVFHLAAESHVDRSIHSASEFVRTNVLGTQNLLDQTLALKKAGRKIRFVHISTDEVYGSLGPEGYFTEETPLDPTSPYAASKAASDLMVLACGKTHGLECVVTRCTNNFGPYQFPEKFIPLFTTNALEDKPVPLYGDGSNVRSWLFVTDHCEGLLLCAEKGRPGEAYNFGSGAEGEIPNIQVAKTILNKLSKPESLLTRVADRPAHDWRYAVDYSKAERELGWKPRTSFETGLARTLEWYVENRKWWEKIKTGEYLKFYEKNYSKRS